jgi:hypothetical protein
MTLVVVCDPEYERFYEDGAIWLVHQHCMQPSHQQPYMTPTKRRMFQDNRRDLDAVTVEAERYSSVSDIISMEIYLCHEDSGASCHLTKDTAGMFDCICIHSFLKICSGKNTYSSRICKKKVTIVQANGSILDLILCDCIYVPDICINLKDYKGSTYNVLVSSGTGESTYEPLDLIASDDPITRAEYALKHNSLDETRWKRFFHYKRNQNTLVRIVNHTKVSINSYGGETF